MRFTTWANLYQTPLTDTAAYDAYKARPALPVPPRTATLAKDAPPRAWRVALRQLHADVDAGHQRMEAATEIAIRAGDASVSAIAREALAEATRHLARHAKGDPAAAAELEDRRTLRELARAMPVQERRLKTLEQQAERLLTESARQAARLERIGLQARYDAACRGKDVALAKAAIARTADARDALMRKAEGHQARAERYRHELERVVEQPASPADLRHALAVERQALAALHEAYIETAGRLPDPPRIMLQEYQQVPGHRLPTPAPSEVMQLLLDRYTVEKGQLTTHLGPVRCSYVTVKGYRIPVAKAINFIEGSAYA